MNISEANVLKLRITYGYKPNIPLVGGFFAKTFDFFSGPKDAFSAKLFAFNRIPIVVDVSAQMLSPAVQNGLKTIGILLRANNLALKASLGPEKKSKVLAKNPPTTGILGSYP